MVRRCGLNRQGRTSMVTRRGPRRCAGVASPCFLVLRSQSTPTDFTPSGRTMEALSPPKHCSPSGCHYLSLSTRIGLDAQWESDGIHHKSPRRRQTWSCGCPLPLRMKCLYPHQLSDVADGLDYLHSCNVIHGDLKGVRDCSEHCFTPALTLSVKHPC